MEGSYTPILDTLDEFFRGEIGFKEARTKIKALHADPRLLTDISNAAKAMLKLRGNKNILPLGRMR